MNKVLKIGISLLIALCFLIPTSAVMADDPRDADNTNIAETISPTVPKKETRLLTPGARIDAMNSPVIEQDPDSEITGVYLGECDSNNMFPLSTTGTSIIPLQDCYEPWFKIMTNVAPNTFEPEVEIYKVNTLDEYCLYETSFEDNAENYMNWNQIDGDCYSGGSQGNYYDGWSWSDQRACGSDHSFKCTMYDEYKNMQQDFIFFEGFVREGIDLNPGAFDLCDGTTMDLDPDYVKVDFDVYVDGQAVTDEGDWCGYQATPLDYLLGGLMDPDNVWVPITTGLLKDGAQVMNFVGDSHCNPIDGDNQLIFWDTNGALREYGERSPAWDWTAYTGDGCEPNCPNLPPIYAEKKADCPGWWHVSYVLDIDALTGDLIEEFKPAFQWVSNKEVVFEGAYIDNLEISVLEPQGNKIYQGHSQQWVTDTEIGESWFQFPLDWDDDIEETFAGCESGTYDANPDYYRMIIKLKNDTGGYDMEQSFKFEIGNQQNFIIKSISVEDDYSKDPIPDGGTLAYPSDAHIMFCYENSETIMGCDANGNPVEMDISTQGPATDVKINAYGYKLSKETLFEDNFDGMSNWATWDDPEGGFHPAYVSDFEPWSGSGCLAFNQEENNMILGGDYNCDGEADQKVRYAAYSQNFFSMENVDEAMLDYYYKAVLPEGAIMYQCMIGTKYIILVDVVAEGPTCQKEWIGPMQPTGVYGSLDVAAKFRLLEALGYMKDANGHDTFETSIGFYMIADDVCKEDLWPECCFDLQEVPWSGVFIDDISVTATVLSDAPVWQDSMVIPGPCEPGQECCDQFTWEDVPYCNYKVIVEVEGDCDMSFVEDAAVCNEQTSDNWLDSGFRVLEGLEHPTKFTAVDYTECTPDAWCVSDVVGNDCGDNHTGDHYALATNCDDPFMPEGGHYTVGFGCLDIEHNWQAPGDDDDDDDCEAYEQPIHPDQANSPGSGSFSDIYYDQQVFDNIVAPYGPCEIGHVHFGGLMAYGDDSPDGAPFLIEFYPDNGAGYPDLTSPYQSELVTIDTYTFDQTWLGYSVWDIEADITPITLSGGDWFSAYHQVGYDEDFAIADDDVGYGDDRIVVYDWVSGWFPDDYYDWAFTLVPTAVIGSIVPEYNCSYPFQDGFESTPFDANWVLNTGWLDSWYGFGPCEGSQWAYSWTAGDAITTPAFKFGNSTDTPAHPGTLITFQYYAESSTHPMDLDIYMDYGLPSQLYLAALYDVTHEDCVTYALDLTGLFADEVHDITFVGMTSDFYGQILDDVKIQTCDMTDIPEEEEPVTGNPMWLNFTYQTDLPEHITAGIFLEWAFVDLSEIGDECTGCEDGCECPQGILSWDHTECAELIYSGHVQIPDTNGACECMSVLLTEMDEGIPQGAPINSSLCLRFRLNTDTEVEGRWLNNGVTAGIGMHIHEMGLTNAYNISLPENAPNGYKDAMWDFEDVSNQFTDIKSPGINDCGWFDYEEHRELGDITLDVDCITFGPNAVECANGCAYIAQCCPGISTYACQNWTLTGQDAWGDGWDACYDYIPDAFIDIYVNGALVVDDFTVTGSSATVGVGEVCPGDEVIVEYVGCYGTFENEHTAQLKDTDGATWWSYVGADHEGMHAPGTVLETVINVPVEIVEFDTDCLWPAEPIHEAIVFETEIEDAYEAYLSVDWQGLIPKGAIAKLQMSADGGNHWYTLDEKDQIKGPSVEGTWHIENFDLTPWAGSSLLIRLYVHNVGYELWEPADGFAPGFLTPLGYRHYNRGYAAICDVTIDGKKDMLPPSATVSLDGNNVGPGLYAGPVTVTIKAVDDTGMGEIHYTLDGEETVVSGDTATFTVSSDGDHVVTYYPVDATGNVGSTGTVSFSIDNSPPTVELTAPEPGLYLFGNKLLSMSKTFIIGAFTAEATADDGQGIAVVQFLLNGEVVSEDTEAPYDAYIAQKNMGAATLTVVALDGVGNSASDSMDITYYKFL